MVCQAEVVEEEKQKNADVKEKQKDDVGRKEKQEKREKLEEKDNFI